MVPSSHIQTTLIAAKSQQGNLRGISSVYYLSHYSVTGVLVCMLPYKMCAGQSSVEKEQSSHCCNSLEKPSGNAQGLLAINENMQSYKISCLSRHRGCPCTYVRCTETCHRIELYWTVKLQRLHSASDW